MTKKLWGFWEAVEVFPWTVTSNPYADWLLKDDWNEKKFNTWLFTEAVMPLHLYNNYLLDQRQADEYLNRNGLTYLDIHDPRKLSVSDSGSALIRYGLNFVSSNVSKLYQ